MSGSGKDSRKTQRVKTVFLKHARLTTFFGAFIVFATFVFKDALREHLKNLMDSIEAAESVSMIRNDMFQANDMLLHSQEVLDDIEERLNKTKSKGSTTTGHEVFLTELQGEIASYSRLQTAADNISRLHRRLPVEEKRNADFLRLERSIDRGIKHIARLSSQGGPTKGQSDQEYISENSDDFSEIHRSILFLRVDMMHLGEDVLKDAEKVRYRDERLYGICTWLSYGLYAVGWGLGLIGRIYGGLDLASSG